MGEVWGLRRVILLPAKIILGLIVISSLYSWKVSSVALFIFALWSVFSRKKEIRNHIAKKNISVNQMWDVKYLGGMQSLVVEKPMDCLLIIDNNNNLIILVGEFEEKIPLEKIKSATLESTVRLGLGKLKLLKISYISDKGKGVNAIFKSFNSGTIAEKIMNMVNA